MAETEVQGLSFTELAERFGTPLYVYDADLLVGQYRRLRDVLHPAMEMFFSLKSNPALAVCAVLNRLGARAEVSSLAELVTARRAGMQPDDIVFVGPGKSREELEACVDIGVHAVVVESAGELALLDEVSRGRGRVTPVALRVNPDFVVKGSQLTMGGRSRQFGIDVGLLGQLAGDVRRLSGVRPIGLHVYLGTRILDEGVVAQNTARILDLARRLAADGWPMAFVDVGGGLGVAYFDGERDPDPVRLAELVNPHLARFTAERPGTRLALELGRYLTAPCGTYLVRVRYVKESQGESWAVVDGGTHHHMAAVGIGSYVKRNFPIRLLRAAAAEPRPWNVAGPLCTPNDTLGWRVSLPRLLPGDLLGVQRSGAYGPTASPGRFLSHGFPAEVLVQDGRAHLIRRRDTVDDLLRQQSLPDGVAVPAALGSPDVPRFH